MKRKKVKYHPCKRLWRLMVYSLVTTSSFLPFPDFSGIFAAHLFTERSQPSSFFRLLQLNPSCCFTINILPIYNKISSSFRKTTYIPFRRGFFCHLDFYILKKKKRQTLFPGSAQVWTQGELTYGLRCLRPSKNGPTVQTFLFKFDQNQ